MKVVIFGVGNHWVRSKRMIDKSIEIVGYMDNNKYTVDGVKVTPPHLWKSLEFEKILICVASPNNKIDIMNQLLKLGIDRRAIGFVESYHPYYLDNIEVVAENTVKVFSGGAQVLCENKIELMIALEIFGNGDYNFSSKDKYFVIDIGMNVGYASIFFAAKENVVAVYGFEPFINCYVKALNNIGINSEKIKNKINTFNVALAERDCIEAFIQVGESESAGIRKTQKIPEGLKTIEVQSKQASIMLENIFCKHNEKCLLKIDCEGGEYAIFQDIFNCDLINKISVIIMEWHEGKFNKIEEYLREAGFEYVLTKNTWNYGKCYAWKI